MDLTLLPVCFEGIDWQSREKLGMELRPTPTQQAHERLPELQDATDGVVWQDLLIVDAVTDAAVLMDAARDCDVVVVLSTELLVVIETVRALGAVSVPVIIAGRENFPGAFFADVYGTLKSEALDAYLAINAADLQSQVTVLRAEKMLRETRALVIGEGWPSFSQVGNPESPRIVEDALGVEIVQRTIADLRNRWEAADRADAESLAAQWLENAAEVDESARRDIVECAKMYLAMDALLEETGATAMTVNCRAWDLLSCEEFGAFYSPCMGLTHLRWRGIPAACEADICALMSMALLNYVTGAPAFLGNIGPVDPEGNSVRIGGHAACTVDMEGEGTPLEGYRLRDYGGRGGVASYLPIEAGRPVTIARFDKSFRHLSLAAGETNRTEQGFEVALGDVSDFMHRCLVGDHYIVAYGDHVEPISRVCERFGVEPLIPAPRDG